MARIRSIHPGIWTDEDFVTMSMGARLLFIGVLNECDDQGAFVWKPIQLKMKLLPADTIDVVGLLDELERTGFVRRYAVNGSSYGAVRHFRQFQRPKKPNALHPVPPAIRAFTGPSTSPPPKGNQGGNGGEPVPGEFPQEEILVEGRRETRGKDPYNPKRKTPPNLPQSGGGLKVIELPEQDRRLRG